MLLRSRSHLLHRWIARLAGRLKMDDVSSARTVSTVLVIATDLNIESLLGELVAFAGHRPVYDAAVGAAGESVRRLRPQVVLLDTALRADVMDACQAAAYAGGTRIVLVSSTATESELAASSRELGCPCFHLPGSPRALRAAIADALGRADGKAQVNIPMRRGEPVHPSICAAIASVARARLLTIQANAAITQNRLLWSELQSLTAETNRSRAALRAAVADYVTHLKADEASMERTLRVVNDAVADCAEILGADAAVPGLLLDAEAWAREAYVTT
jgi:DNA-binding response OmpR family regulator